ncbi:MAG: PTS system mannose/fructose/sorbose family transporter subunit IID [Elusimicrobiota bacterium]
MAILDRRDLLLIFFRSFLLQLGWNYDRKQAFGFTYIIAPYLRRFYKDPDEQKNAILRNLTFFNSHPCLSNSIVGTVLALEEKRAAGGGIDENVVSTVKTQMAGPIAALGDLFFWSTWRPLVALSTMAFFFAFKGAHEWMPALIFLLLYNSVHLPIRYYVLLRGYYENVKFIQKVKEWNVQKYIDKMHIFGVVLIIGLTGYTIFFMPWQFSEKVLMVVFFVVSTILLMLQVSSTKLFYLVIILGVLLSYFKII